MYIYIYIQLSLYIYIYIYFIFQAAEIDSMVIDDDDDDADIAAYLLQHAETQPATCTPPRSKPALANEACPAVFSTP